VITLSLVDIVILAVLAVFFFSVFLFSRSGNDLSPTYPSAYKAANPLGRSGREGRRLAVCAGDSLTRGAVSVDYVAMLDSRLADWEFSNAGVNAELAFNLAERMGDIVALDPDAVTILIGTNDVNATFGFQAAYGYIAAKRLPERPGPLFFRECLVGIVRTLKRTTRARIALFSIPPIGEDPGHYAYIRTEDYANIIKEAAKEEGVEYLPLRERLCSYIESLPPHSPPPLGFRSFGKAQLDAGRAQRYLGKSLDEISASNRFRLLVDGIHLNSHGAAIAAELAELFLRSI
jgi:acyl-CoA thioesterase I